MTPKTNGMNNLKKVSKLKIFNNFRGKKMAVEKEQVIEALKKVMDPEMPISVYDMGLIYDIDISKDDKVDIKMTLTTPGCHMSNTLMNDVQEGVEEIDGVKAAEINIVWDPPWTLEKMTEEGKRIIQEMQKQSP